MLVSNKFDELIKSKIGDTKPSNSYTFPNTRSKKIALNENDSEPFKELYGVTGGHQGIGHGEVALYWLFQKQIVPSDNSNADLTFKGKRIEVKSYARNSPLVLGKWKDNQQIRKIINAIFSCYNLIHWAEGTMSEIGFTPIQLEEAMESTLTFHESMTNTKTMDILKQTTEELKKEFFKLSKNRGRDFLEATPENRNKIIKEAVADIIYSLVESKLKYSGDLGYLINVPKKSRGDMDIIEEIDIFKLKGISKDTETLHKSFYVTSGEVRVRPSILELN